MTVRLNDRIGGHSPWVLCEDTDLMQVPPALLECVCYIEVNDHLMGTGFFLGYPLNPGGEGPQRFVYVTTARHVIELDEAMIARIGAPEKITLRINTRDGGFGRVETSPDDWVRHPGADLAMTPLAPDIQVFDYHHFPTEGMLNVEVIDRLGLWVGAETLTPGLLVNQPGISQVQPVVRFGHVAGLGTDPVKMKVAPGLVVEDNAILIEGKSLGGVSGAPVFVHVDDWRRDANGVIQPLTFTGFAGTTGPNYLLGLVHGFFGALENEVPTPEREFMRQMNSGIQIVVPWSRIEGLLQHPDLVGKRRKEKEEFDIGNMPEALSIAADESDTIALTAELMGKLLQASKDEIMKDQS